jgi:hypothetical protein
VDAPSAAGAGLPQWRGVGDPVRRWITVSHVWRGREWPATLDPARSSEGMRTCGRWCATNPQGVCAPRLSAQWKASKERRRGQRLRRWRGMSGRPTSDRERSRCTKGSSSTKKESALTGALRGGDETGDDGGVAVQVPSGDRRRRRAGVPKAKGVRACTKGL